MSAPDFRFRLVLWRLCHAGIPNPRRGGVLHRSQLALSPAQSLADNVLVGMGFFPEIQLANGRRSLQKASVPIGMRARVLGLSALGLRFVTSFSYRLNNNASLKRIHVISLRQSNCLVKLIDDIRRENLAKLAEELGSITALAKQLDRSDSPSRPVDTWGQPIPLLESPAECVRTQLGSSKSNVKAAWLAGR